MILITGATGYIGSHTWLTLINSGIKVIGIDNFSNSYPTVVNRIHELTNSKSIIFFEVDVNDKKALVKLFKLFSFEAVIHFAAHKSVTDSFFDPLGYYKNNVGGLITLLQVMSEFNCKKIIYSSSASIYGLKNRSPLNENCIPYPTNPYAQTKLTGEILLNSLINKNWSIGILRYFNVFGAHSSGLIGEVSKNPTQNLISALLQVATAKSDYLKIFGGDYSTKDGTAIRDYIHIQDLADAHINSLNYLNKELKSFVLNIGSGTGYSVLEVIRAFERINNLNIPYKIMERRMGDIDISFASNLKAQKLLNWSNKFHLDDMCKSTWAWQIKNPNGYK